MIVKDSKKARLVKINQFIHSIYLGITQHTYFFPAKIQRLISSLEKKKENLVNKWYNLEIYEKDGDRNLCWIEDEEKKGHYLVCPNAKKTKGGPIISEGKLIPTKEKKYFQPFNYIEAKRIQK